MTYQTNSLSEYCSKGIKDIHHWIEPLGPSIFITLGLIQPLELLLKDGENIVGRVAGLELGGKWMDQ